MVAAKPTRSQANSSTPFKGYVPVPRSFFDHPVWQKRRAFSPAEALLDLYRLARCLPTESLKRGEFQRSTAELATRWTWTQSRVKRFMAARVKDGTLREVPTEPGETCKFALCEVRQLVKTPTKPVDDVPAEPPAEPPKPAPVVECEHVVETTAVAEPATPEQKKESNKERKASEFRSAINGESPHISILEQPTKPEPPAVSPQVEILQGTGTMQTEAEREQRQQWAKTFHEVVRPEAYRLRLPLSKDQVRMLRTRMSWDLLPYPKPGSWLARQMQRPI